MVYAGICPLPLVVSTQKKLISLISQRHSHSCCLQGRRLVVLAVLAKTGFPGKEVDPKK